MKLAPTFTKTNQNVYDSLYVSLLDGLGTLQLLIAVCENDRLRFDIIERYEQVLKEEARGFRVTLDPAEPSLRQSLQTLTDWENLAASKSHFVTVLGAERLDEASLNKFWGYLQWTREGLRALACPIVLWIPQRVLREMVKKAPDFWRWRNGVFVFTSPDLPDWEEKPLPLREALPGRESGLFSPEQLEDSLQRGLIAWGEESPKLIPIYAQLGDAYVQKILHNQGSETDAERAEFLLKQAINHEVLSPDSLVRSLNALGLLYQYQGKYEEAEPLLVKALEIERQSSASDHYTLATTLNNLAGLYRAQAKTSQAESLYLEALALIRQEVPENLATLSIALNNLAGLYQRQERYSEAEALYREALAIDRQSLPLNHPQLAIHLNNLAGLYRKQKRYSEAEALGSPQLQPRATSPSVRSPLKRAMDIAGALVGLGITGLLFIPIALAIKLDSPGPIFFSQTRCGWMGRRFRLYKFRSMCTDVEQQNEKIVNEIGALFKSKNDPRITRVGRFLRKTSLDELPLFWNVLLGDMSLVGTRPPTPDEVEKYEVPAWQYLDVKPGMTGEWRVSGHSMVSNFQEVIRLDLKYQEKWSHRYDLKLILKTLLVSLRKVVE